MLEELVEHVDKIILLIADYPQEDLVVVEELAQQMKDELNMIVDN